MFETTRCIALVGDKENAQDFSRSLSVSSELERNIEFVELLDRDLSLV